MKNDFKISDFKQIADAIKKFDYYVIVGHNNPDGDSKGSCECLGRALSLLNPKSYIYPKIGTTIKQCMDEPQLNEPYCFIQLDVQPEYRLEKGALELKQNSDFSICIDHHQQEEPNCNLVFVDSKASANALIVWDFIKFLGVEINKEIATAAYTGLCSDTNSFMNTNTDIRSFKAAIEMLSYDVSPSEVAKKLFQSRSLASFNLEKIILDRLYVDKENRFALSYLTADNYSDFGATKDDSDAMIDLLRELECVDVACVVRQEKVNDKIHASIRSKTDIDVSLLAKKHIGGGHKAAAGMTIQETDIKKAVSIIKDQLALLMQGRI